MKRYLTKSRFQLGRECPTKLFYTGKKEYGNTKPENAFLSALAEGGFQIGALARLYYPGGVTVETLDYEASLAETNALLAQENVTIFEAAIRFRNLFVRVDILQKTGDVVELIEVKAKSFDPTKDTFFQKRDNVKKLRYNWEQYLNDIAFQHYVLKQAFPHFTVKPSLYLTDKTAVASVDGLHQNFVITKGADNRAQVNVTRALSPEELGRPLLVKVDAEEAVAEIQSATKPHGKTFEAWVAFLADKYEKDEKVSPRIGSQCKNCEFHATSAGEKDGFKECWSLYTPSPGPYILSLWRGRYPDQWIGQGKLLLSDVTTDMINPEPQGEGLGLSATERQWLQVEKHVRNDRTPFLDKTALAKHMSAWKFPLHFVDFETCRAAIPFNKGQRPYATTAFQFSHHTVSADGKIAHTGEYINERKGFFPNVEFLRKLKAELDKDQGSFFCYHIHELTVLAEISEQLEVCDIDASERKELQAFVLDIHARAVDLCELVVRHYYHPATNGSNSLKKVLPATLNESVYLQEKYAKPIYGAEGGIPSKNFKDFQWITRDEKGNVIDPYELLGKFATSDIDDIHEGGAAMTAYSRLQFTEIGVDASSHIIKSLLRYCELDTFATVLLYEYWKETLK